MLLTTFPWSVLQPVGATTYSRHSAAGWIDNCPTAPSSGPPQKDRPTPRNRVAGCCSRRYASRQRP